MSTVILINCAKSGKYFMYTIWKHKISAFKLALGRQKSQICFFQKCFKCHFHHCHFHHIMILNNKHFLFLNSKNNIVMSTTI